MVRDQATDLRNKVNRSLMNSHARTIAIFSGKGGVGKSNFALNFGICLSKQGKKVLIFDLDIGMGNIDILLGFTPENTLTTMFEKNMQISDIIEIGPCHLSYIASGNGLSTFFHLDSVQYDYFTTQLEIISSQYDYILFDLGAGMSEEHLAFISAADECFVISTTEPTSYTDAYSAMKHVILNDPNVKLSLLLNRVTSTKEQNVVFRRIHSVVQSFLHYDLKLLGSLPDDPIVTEAVKQQIPFYQLDSRAKVSKALAKIVLDYLKDQKQEVIDASDDDGFINRLKSIFIRKVD